MNPWDIVITLLIALAVSFLSSAALEWWLRRRDAKRQAAIEALVGRFAETEPQRGCRLPDVELVEGLEREAIANHNAQVAQALYPTPSPALQESLRKVRAVVAHGMSPRSPIGRKSLLKAVKR